MTTRSKISRWLTLLLAAPLLGCAATPKPPPGMAMIQVQVRTQPKAGYVEPGSSSEYGPPSGDSETGQMARVNYWHLPNIVVYLEPLDHQTPSASAAPIAVQLKQPESDLFVTSVGGQITCRNDGAKPERAYLRSDSFANLGVIAPGAEKKYVFENSGAYDLATDSKDDAITSIFVAPTAWAQKTHCNQVVTFGPLPPGRYRVVSWHRRLPGSTQEVTLAPGATEHATVTISVNSLPKMP